MDTLFFLSYINWNVDPEIFRIGDFAIRWYGLLFASGFYFGYLVLTRVFKWENIPVEVLDKLTLYMIIGTVVGARLGHVLFYEPGYYLSNPFEIVKIWHGGLASHGAAIGILLSLWFFSRKETEKSYLWVVDRIVMVVASAGVFIRLGNLMNSEIVGEQADVPWAFIFHRLPEIPVPRHPTQIYEAIAYVIIFVFLFYFIYKPNFKKLKDGVIFSVFLILLFFARFMIEFFKEEQVAFEESMVLNMGQLLSIPFILIGIGLLVWLLSRPRKGSIVRDV